MNVCCSDNADSDVVAVPVVPYKDLLCFDYHLRDRHSCYSHSHHDLRSHHQKFERQVVFPRWRYWTRQSHFLMHAGDYMPKFGRGRYYL